MKRRSCLLALTLLVLLAASSSSASETDKGPIFTASQLNGRGWLGLDEPSKVFYVIGLHNGLRYASIVLQDGKAFASVYIPAARFGEIAKGLDLFYGDPANVDVPIYEAFRIFKMRLTGTPKADIEKATEDARKFAHEEIVAEHRD